MTNQINQQGKNKRYAKNKLDRAIHEAFLNLKWDHDHFTAFQKILIHVQQTAMDLLGVKIRVTHMAMHNVSDFGMPNPN